MHTEIRAANYPDKIKNLLSQYPFDDFIPLLVGRTDVEKHGMIIREETGTYTLLVSKSNKPISGFNVRISVTGPKKERTYELIQEFQNTTGIKTRPAPQYVSEAALTSDKQLQTLKIGSLEDLYALCLVCDTCQKYYLLNLPRDPSNQEILEHYGSIFLTANQVQSYSLSPRIQDIVSKKLRIPYTGRGLMKEDLEKALGKLSRDELIEKVEECSIVKHHDKNKHEPIEGLFDNCVDCLGFFEEAIKTMTGQHFVNICDRREFKSIVVMDNLFLNLLGQHLIDIKNDEAVE
jgi:hypothetical protein